jgi:FKBP12-rapamycin complex-associated protein
VDPYTDYPVLLGLLLRLLNGDLAWSTRREVLKVLGIMGALDPHQHKRNQLLLQQPHKDSARMGGSETGPYHARSLEEVPLDLLPSGGLFTTSEDYYPTVAINALMRILRDPTLSSYHSKVVGSLMYIFRSMGLGCVPYLPKVLPDWFEIVHTCEDGLREHIFTQLAVLVSIVRQVCRVYPIPFSSPPSIKKIPFFSHVGGFDCSLHFKKMILHVVGLIFLCIFR